MDGIDHVRGWVARHLVVLDVLLVLVAAFFAVGPTLVGQDQDELGLDFHPGSSVLAVLASLTMLLRRRHPRVVWVAAVALGFVALVIDGEPSSAYIPAYFALYTLATSSPLRVTIVASTLTALVPVAVAIHATDSVAESLGRGLAVWALLFGSLGIAVRSHRQAVAEAQGRARLAEATREEEAQRRVAEERLRIARELHDVVAHHISVINVQAGVAGHLVRTNPDRAVEALAHVREASQIVLREVPGLLGLLRSDEELERAPVPGLAEAGRLIEDSRRSGIEVAWSTTGAPWPLTPGADLAAYRVLQEALTNAGRHGTGRTNVAFTFDESGFTLDVLNERRRNGIGDSAAPPYRERHGLVGMRERVASVGGELTAGPHGSSDWRVHAHLPDSRAATEQR